MQDFSTLTINDGTTLEIGNDLLVAGTAAVTVNGGGTLIADGVTGDVTVNSGGTLNIETITGTVTLDGTATLIADEFTTSNMVLTGAMTPTLTVADLTIDTALNTASVTIPSDNTTTVITGGTLSTSGAFAGGTWTIGDGVAGTLSLTGNATFDALTFDAGTLVDNGNTLTAGTLRILDGSTVTPLASATDEYILENVPLDVRVVGLPDAPHPDTLLADTNITALGGTVDLNKRVYTTGFLTVEDGTTNLNAAPSGELHTIGGGITVNAGTLNVDAEVVATEAVDVFSGGTVNLNANLTTTAVGDRIVGSPDALNHYGYHTGPNGVMDLNNNGGMMGGGDPTQGPTFHGQALLTDGPAGRGLNFDNDGDFTATGAIGQNDNYSNMWIGLVFAPETGQYEFRNMGDDDRGGIWIDLDQDGVFESSTAGLGSNRGEQLSWEDGGWKAVTLTAGESYMIAFTHSEGTGGSRADFAFHTPSIGGDTRVKPSDPAQAGIWWAAQGGFGSTSVLAGGTMNINSGATLTTDRVVLSGTMNVNDGGAVRATGVDVSGSGMLNLIGLESLDDGVTETPVTVTEGGTLNIQVPQTYGSAMEIKAYGLLKGDVTNQAYGAGGITFDDNALLADDITGLPQPTAAQIGGRKLLIPILTGGEVPVNNIGDAANAYKGAYFGGLYDGSTFTGTLTSVSGADVDVQLGRNVTFSGATLNSDTTVANIDILSGQMALGAGSIGGTATQVNVSADADNTHVLLLQGDGAIADGLTVRISGGRAVTDNVNNIRGTLEVGADASLYLQNNITTPTRESTSSTAASCESRMMTVSRPSTRARSRSPATTVSSSSGPTTSRGTLAETTRRSCSSPTS